MDLRESGCLRFLTLMNEGAVDFPRQVDAIVDSLKNSSGPTDAFRFSVRGVRRYTRLSELTLKVRGLGLRASFTTTTAGRAKCPGKLERLSSSLEAQPT